MLRCTLCLWYELINWELRCVGEWWTLQSVSSKLVICLGAAACFGEWLQVLHLSKSIEMWGKAIEKLLVSYPVCVAHQQRGCAAQTVIPAAPPAQPEPSPPSERTAAIRVDAGDAAAGISSENALLCSLCDFTEATACGKQQLSSRPRLLLRLVGAAVWKCTRGGGASQIFWPCFPDLGCCSDTSSKFGAKKPSRPSCAALLT